MEEFIQQGPQLENQFTSDELLKTFLSYKLPAEFSVGVFSDLTRFGNRVVTDVLAFAEDAEKHPPELIKYDAWGTRVDNVKVAEGWSNLHRVSAEEEIVRLGYIRPYGAYSRTVQFAKLYLFHPSSSFYSCPLAMTDGAAKLIETHGDAELKENAFTHLISNDPDFFWTSAQWMTERSGGSDVSQTETVAKKIDDEWHLYGTKWFCSAVTSGMCMLLAKIEGEKRLSLFYVELGDLKFYEILRLKNKLGTKALPTAEVKLNGIRGKLIGESGDGVKLISSMFNVTRLYNSVTSVAAFRRILVLAKDYAHKRKAFGKSIIEHPLLVLTLSEAQIEFHANFHLTFLISEIMGIEEVYSENNSINLKLDEVRKLLRLLTPVVKLYTAKKVMCYTSELLEVFGGVGYIEDSGIPQLLRDNQVFSLWEGTTNVLSLDFLRAVKNDSSFEIWTDYIQKKLSNIKTEELKPETRIITSAVLQLSTIFNEAVANDKLVSEGMARDITFSVARITASVGMLEYADQHESIKNAVEIVRLFLLKNPCRVENFDNEHYERLKNLIT
jgi:putative acyl-CoA dehydrogenase